MKEAMRKRLAITVCVIVMLCVFSVGFTSRAVAAEKFRIGFAVALTGIFGKAGAMVKDAYQIWADRINEDGGILVQGKRYPVELIFYDDKSTPATSAKLVEKLISHDRVDLLLGGYGSSQVFAASAVSEKYKYPMISGGASSNKLFERGFKYYFSTLGKATEEVKGCVDIVQTMDLKPKTAAIVGADILFTSLACEGYKKYAPANGLEVIHFELFPLSLADYNSMLIKVKHKNPDVLLIGSHLMVAIKTMKALKEIDFSPKLVGFSYGPTVPDFVKQLGKDAEYAVAASEWTPNLPYKGPVFGTAVEFNNLYIKTYNRAPDYVEAAATGGAVVQQMAIQKLGITPPVKEKDRVALMEELHRIDVDTFYGHIRFGADGANVAHPPVAIQIQDGKRVNVFPTEAAEAKPRLPFKPWKER